MMHRLRRVAAVTLAVVVSGALAAGAIALTSRGQQRAPAAEPVSQARPMPDEPAPAPAPTALPTGSAAPGSEPLGLRWSWAQPDTFDFVARASGGWTFAEVLWCDIQPEPGTWEWTALDAVVRDARTLGHETMLKLRTGQCWGAAPAPALRRDVTENVDKDPSTPATDLAAYLAFVRAVVGRYAARGIDYYAIENEPDTVNHWAAPIASYRSTARAVAAAIHQVDPGALVLDGGVSSTAYGVAMAAAQIRREPRRALHTYRAYYARRIAGSASRFPDVRSVRELRRVLGSDQARRAIRAVDIAVDLANAGVLDRYQLHYYEPPDQLPRLLQFLDGRLRQQVPVEAWEIGIAWPGPGFTERAQATQVFRIVALLLAAQVRRTVYLPAAYTAAPGKLQVFRGLTEPDGTTYPAGDGWLALVDALAGLHDVRVRPAGGRLAGATWQIGGRQAALVWARSGPVALEPTDVRMVMDATGAVVPGAPVVGRDPVLVLGSARGDLTAQVARGAR